MSKLPEKLGKFSIEDALKLASPLGYSVPVEARYRDLTSTPYIYSEYYKEKQTHRSRNYEKFLNGNRLPEDVFYDPLHDNIIVEFSTWTGSLLDTEATWFFAKQTSFPIGEVKATLRSLSKIGPLDYSISHSPSRIVIDAHRNSAEQKTVPHWRVVVDNAGSIESVSTFFKSSRSPDVTDFLAAYLREINA